MAGATNDRAGFTAGRRLTGAGQSGIDTSLIGAGQCAWA
jgi:hypothetical protein